MSQQQSTQAKIATQGGVDAAVGTDVTDATLKASKQQASVESELAQQIKSNNPEMSDKVAKDIARAFTESGGKVTDDIAKALSAGVDINAVGSSAIASAGVLAGTMVGGKTAKDIKTVDEANDSDKTSYVQTQSEVGVKAGEQLKRGSELMQNRDRSTELYSDFVKSVGNTAANEYKEGAVKGITSKEQAREAAEIKATQSLLDIGALEDDGSGNLIASVGEKQIKARAAMSTGNAIEGGALNLNGHTFQVAQAADGSYTISGKSGVSNSSDNSYTGKSGTHFKTYASNIIHDTQADAQRTKEMMNHVDSENIPAAISETVEPFSNLLQEAGFEESTADSIAAYVVGGLALAGVTEAGTGISNLIKGERIHKSMGDAKLYKDKDENSVIKRDETTYTGKDADGKKVAFNGNESELKYEHTDSNNKRVYTDTKGNEFTQGSKTSYAQVNKDGSISDFKGNPENLKTDTRVKGGNISEFARKGAGNLRDKGVELKHRFFSSDESISKPDNTSDYPNNPDNKQKTKNNTDDVGHDNSLNKDEEKTPPAGDSVAKDKESVKSQENGGKATTISQEIDQQTTATRRNEEMSNAQKVRDNKLAVADSPEAVEKINNEYEAKSKATKQQWKT